MIEPPRRRRTWLLLILLLITAGTAAAIAVQADRNPTPAVVPYDPLPRW